jgi:hypothetical protein
MQPEQPNPHFIVMMMLSKMISTAGAKEVELQGASSVVRGNATLNSIFGPQRAVVEAVQGET